MRRRAVIATERGGMSQGERRRNRKIIESIFYHSIHSICSYRFRRLRGCRCCRHLVTGETEWHSFCSLEFAVAAMSSSYLSIFLVNFYFSFGSIDSALSRHRSVCCWLGIIYRADARRMQLLIYENVSYIKNSSWRLRTKNVLACYGD